ncbi:MAG: hypothetical protein COB02_10635 [Candidatus Cloacimonadota bacterium]|nr:MAG: hypothetical protein COB02_10635 [Candidatus Cloacimonadota bacterium]
MELFFIVFTIFTLCFLGLAVGVMITGKTLSGSCGGRKVMVDGIEVEMECICDSTGDPNACDSTITEDKLIAAMKAAKNS